MTYNDCRLEEIADQWWFCRECGGLLYGPTLPRRTCPRGRLLADLGLAVMRDIPTRSVDQMRATVETCFGGRCDHLESGLCTRRGSDCKRRQVWLDVIMFSGCDLERLPYRG